jgi:hypothetical protein
LLKVACYVLRPRLKLFDADKGGEEPADSVRVLGMERDFQSRMSHTLNEFKEVLDKISADDDAK